MLFFMTWIFQFIAQNITQISESYKCTAPFSLIYRSIFIAPVRLIIVTLSITHKRDFLWPESCPIITPNSTQMSELIKCLARFSLIYRSIFIAPVRLIIVTLSFADQWDFLWPESRPIIAQNFTQMSEQKNCLARLSLIYCSIFIAPVRLIIVTLSIAHQQDFLRLESCPYLAQSFHTGSLDGWSHVPECLFEFQKLPKFGCYRLWSKQTECKQRFPYLYQALIIVYMTRKFLLAYSKELSKWFILLW